MRIYPAIDLYEKQVVRLYKGDYNQMTVYGNDPTRVALSFKEAGAEYLHCVDLEGAKDGTTPNLEVVADIVKNSGLKTEIGGGIRSIDVIEKYLSAGVDRVILGTAAVTNPDFLKESLRLFGDKIAVGVDIKDNYVAIKGWTEQSALTCDEFFAQLQELGVKTVICTDISKDGAMKGTNIDLYKHLSETYSIDLVASGGVSTPEDVKKLNDMNIHGAILGKALYTGAIDLKQAIAVTKGETA